MRLLIPVASCLDLTIWRAAHLLVMLGTQLCELILFGFCGGRGRGGMGEGISVFVCLWLKKRERRFCAGTRKETIKTRVHGREDMAPMVLL